MPKIVNAKNPLGYQDILQLIKKLAIPAVIANIINALYNVVDQIFIGQGVGYLGNAATNIAFPLTTICLALGNMTGIGAASRFNLELGKGHNAKAKQAVGTATSLLFILGLLLFILVQLFLTPMLKTFGATSATFSYAKTYTQITSLGMPFLLLTMGMNPLVRADGASTYSMLAIVIGAVLNTFGDMLFMFGFHWGIAGTAWSTVISQIISALVLLGYYPRFKSIKLTLKDFKINIATMLTIFSLGIGSFVFQSSNILVQIVTNNVFKDYGAHSTYGSDIPIAIAGITIKINVIFTSVVIGIVQGTQPISSFNYGAQNYRRVQETIKTALKIIGVVSLIYWSLFEVFPYQILSFFGSGSRLYFEFGVRYMRFFFLFAIVNGVQIFSATFFSSIGKAKIGAFISLIKQLGLIIPSLLIFPFFLGINGLVYATPTADCLAFLLAAYLLYREYQKMQKQAELLE